MPTTNYSELYVLIIDDFHNFRSALAKNMYTLGFRHINTVSSGNEAMNICRKDHYDLILSDYNLGGGKNGQQILEELRYLGVFKRSDLFILISADTSREVVMSSYDCEPSDYLTKPITGKTLEQRIKRVMAKRTQFIDIYNAIDEELYGRAITLLEMQIEEGSRYKADCQKLLGEMYIKDQQYDMAESIYSEVLAVRDVDWAQVGLANLSLERGNADQAIKSLEDVVIHHPAYLKAYDSLSKACVVVGDNEKLQSVLERAVEISPLSIGRQKILADTALANGNVELAMEAYKKTIKYGANSHYDTVDNHLNFARSITKTYDNDMNKAKDMSLSAANFLNNLDDLYEVTEDQKIQAKLLNSQINSLQGNKRASTELLSEAKELMVDRVLRDVDVEVETVNALVMSDRLMDAKKILTEMLDFYKDDQSALEKIDPLLEEPVSIQGKKIIGTINKKGIDFYREKEFEQSIDYFTQAQKKYPRYIGLKLNLVQAMISDVKENGLKEAYILKCETIFKVVERHISSADEKYQRYKQLNLMYKQIVQQAKFKARTDSEQESVK